MYPRRDGYVQVQRPPGVLPPKPPSPAGLGPPRRGIPMAPRLRLKCQQLGHYTAQCSAHAHAHVAQNYPPNSGDFGAHTASFNTLPPQHHTTEFGRPGHTMSGNAPTSSAPQYVAAAPYAPSTIYSPYGLLGAAESTHSSSTSDDPHVLTAHITTHQSNTPSIKMRHLVTFLG